MISNPLNSANANHRTSGVASPMTSESVPRWFVLHTRSRQEKMVAADLTARGVPHYLPLQEDLYYRGRRKITTTNPVYPGYVFVHGHEEAAYPIDRNRRLVRIIPVIDQHRLKCELDNLRQVLERNIRVETHAYLHTGICVEVHNGPLKGIQGIIDTIASPHRLVLQVEMLGQATSVEVDASFLTPIDSDPEGPPGRARTDAHPRSPTQKIVPSTGTGPAPRSRVPVAFND